MGTQEGEKDWVDVAIDLLRKCRINLRLTKLADCDGNVFIAFYENILGEKVPDFIAEPKSQEDDIHNVQSVIDSLALDYLQISLSHITGENIVRGDKETVKNLLEIFDGLLEYLNEEISDELHTEGLNDDLRDVFGPAVGHEQEVAAMLERASLSSTPAPLEPLPSAVPLRPPYQATTPHPLHGALPPSGLSLGLQERQGGAVTPEPSSKVIVANGHPSSSQSPSPAPSARSECSQQRISPLQEVETLQPTSGGARRVLFHAQPDVLFLSLPEEADPNAANNPLDMGGEDVGRERTTVGRKNKATEQELHHMSEKVSQRLQDLDQMLQRVLGESGDSGQLAEDNQRSHHEDGYTHIDTPRPQTRPPMPPRSPSPPWVQRPAGPRRQTNLQPASTSARRLGRERRRLACQAREEARLAQERLRAQAAEREYREAILRDLPQTSRSSPGQRGKKPVAQPHSLPLRPGADPRRRQDAPRRSPPMKVKENDLLPVLLQEFPLLRLSPHGQAQMWQQQMGQTDLLHSLAAASTGQHQQRQLGSQVEDAQRRRDLLTEIVRKEREHNKRLRDFKKRIQQQKSSQNHLREQRQQVARAKSYHRSYHTQLHARLTNARSKEEKMLREVFSEGLALQKARLNEERSYAREQRREQNRHHLDHISSVENYYRDQFSLLAETLAQEGQEIQVRRKAQEKALAKMKRELRTRMERDIGQLQSAIVQNDQDDFFRDLEVQRLRKRVQMASFQYSSSSGGGLR
ncbi:hypothetical protein NHX12_017831 [Muraenolepis orangiensis]|uniref:DUF5745 domain-containing protein n=1 Tax=Muraenolepis orangiensis TaxID=630683 RepID=A0A9Q0EVB0_9TELE|nr:hypothetical protein NHX12_017831 [Muraenolepis orangiensis]